MYHKIRIFIFTLFFFTLNAQTVFELQKLKDFAKTYGVIRYFHPSDEAASIDWNYFASYGVEKISQSKNQKEFEAELKNLFQPVAPSVTFITTLYNWNTTPSLHPVFWIHNGLGIDNIKVRKDYTSKRFNKETASKNESRYVYINIKPIHFQSDIKITYEAKSSNSAASFAYANIYTEGNEKPLFQTHQYEPITSIEWQQKELLISNHLPINRINFGLLSSKQGSEFRNVKLWLLNDKKEWITSPLPPFTNEEWKANNTETILERYDSGFRFKDTTVNDTKTYDINWDKYVKLDLSNNISLSIPTVVYSDKNSTLPISDQQQLKRIQTSLKQQPFNKNIAFANVIICWNIFKHFYPYQDVVKVNWDSVLETALKDAYDDTNEYDNYLTLSRFLSNFNDGHMSVSYQGLSEKRKYAPGISVRYRNNVLVVKNVKPDLKDIQKGDIITAVNGIPTVKYMDSLQQYLSGSKHFREWNSSLTLLRGTLNSNLNLNLKAGKTIALTRNIEFVPNVDFYTRDDVTKAQEINQETYYVNMDKLSEEEMEAEVSNIRKYKNLIIDLRGYPRTDQKHRLLNYLLPIADSTKWLCSKQIYLPDFKYYKETCNGHRLRKFISDNPLKINTVLLVDERSVSNAEMFSQTVKHYKLATIIGRPTAGANGNRNDINLLNGFQISFTGMKVTNPDETLFHAVGVIPDILVNETPDDIKSGKDIYMEKALEFFLTKK